MLSSTSDDPPRDGVARGCSLDRNRAPVDRGFSGDRKLAVRSSGRARRRRSVTLRIGRPPAAVFRHCRARYDAVEPSSIVSKTVQRPNRSSTMRSGSISPSALASPPSSPVLPRRQRGGDDAGIADSRAASRTSPDISGQKRTPKRTSPASSMLLLSAAVAKRTSRTSSAMKREGSSDRFARADACRRRRRRRSAGSPSQLAGATGRCRSPSCRRIAPRHDGKQQQAADDGRADRAAAQRFRLDGCPSRSVPGPSAEEIWSET